MKQHPDFPTAFETRLRKSLGQEWEAFTEVFRQPVPVSVRINPGKKNNYQHIPESVPWSAYGKYLSERPSFTRDPLFHAGTYYVQEASSMFLEQALRQHVDLRQPLNVLDLCAAPGGKSTHIVSLIHPESLLVSNEVIRSRASILSENILKWGSPNVIVTNSDPEHFASLRGFFDVVVIDAPCSGEGLFRKDPEAMQEWSPQNAELCSARQKRILADAWPCLKENGLLVYCTCTYNESENEQNLAWLEKEHEVEFLPLQTEAGWNIEEVRKGNAAGYRFFPHRVKGEGFFISVMQKKQHEPPARSKTKNPAPVSKKVIETISGWIQEPGRFQFFAHQDLVFFLPESKATASEIIKQHLRIVSGGTPAATIKHDKVIPEHALAMSIHLALDKISTLPVTYEEAIRYLRKDVLNLADTSKGYHLLTYETVPIGWVNSLGNRFNNLYPSEWRVRMEG